MPWGIAGLGRSLWVKSKPNTNPDAEGEAIAVASDLPAANEDGDPERTRLLVRNGTDNALVWVQQGNVEAKETAKRPRQKVVASTAGAAGGVGLVELAQALEVNIPDEWSLALGPLVALVAGYLTPPGKTG